MMSGIFAHVSVAALVLFALAQPAQAQGSMGGSIGVQEKSVSGDRDAPKAAPSPRQRTAPKAAPKASAKPQRSAPELKRAAARKGGGGGANYDGVWFVNNIGCGGSAGRVVVSGGRINGDGGVTGSVSAGGAVRTATAVSVGWGQVSGNRGSGGFRTNDGCTGRWTSSR